MKEYVKDWKIWLICLAIAGILVVSDRAWGQEVKEAGGTVLQAEKFAKKLNSFEIVDGYTVRDATKGTVYKWDNSKLYLDVSDLRTFEKAILLFQYKFGKSKSFSRQNLKSDKITGHIDRNGRFIPLKKPRPSVDEEVINAVVTASVADTDGFISLRDLLQALRQGGKP